MYHLEHQSSFALVSLSFQLLHLFFFLFLAAVLASSERFGELLPDLGLIFGGGFLCHSGLLLGFGHHLKFSWLFPSRNGWKLWEEKLGRTWDLWDALHSGFDFLQNRNERRGRRKVKGRRSIPPDNFCSVLLEFCLFICLSPSIVFLMASLYLLPLRYVLQSFSSVFLPFSSPSPSKESLL